MEFGPRALGNRSILADPTRADMKDLIFETIEGTVNQVVIQYLFSGEEEITFDIEGLDNYLRLTFNFELGSNKEKIKDMNREEIQKLIFEGVCDVYTKKEAEIGTEQLRKIERMLLMQTIDLKWKDHLYAMDQLKEGISLRSFAQRDPLIEYKREGFEMFQMMYDSIHQEVSEVIFKIQQAGPSQRIKSVFDSLPQQFVHDEAAGLSQSAAQQRAQLQQPNAAPQPAAPVPIRKEGPKVGRNEPCPCGSGKKYKKCCGR